MAEQDIFDTCYNFTAKCEGGWSNNACDHGGATNRGITLAVWRAYNHDQTLTADDLSNATEDDAKAIYAKNYYNYFVALPAALRLSVVDMSFNSGVTRAAELLQRTVGTKPDGQIGAVTLAAIAKHDAKLLVNSYAAICKAFYISLDQPVFINGWENRCENRRKASLALC